jgi:methylglutaconyl-CoA hydratase
VKAIVLAANGPAFCAGADLNWMRSMADYTRDENLGDAGRWPHAAQVSECPKPTIARVQGDVYAGGTGAGGGLRHGGVVDTASTA